MIKKIILTTLGVLLCGCAVDNRSDLAAEHNGYVNNLNLLQIDKKSGVSRRIEKVTRETVDTVQDVHNKVVTIQEELSKGHVKGKAEAEMTFDSKTRERSGKRSLMVEDDGSGSLSEFVEKFETVQYKKIANDVFVDKSEEKSKSDTAKEENITDKVVSDIPTVQSSQLENNSASSDSLKGKSVYTMQPVSSNIEKNNKKIDNSSFKQDKPNITSEIKANALGEIETGGVKPMVLHDFSKNS